MGRLAEIADRIDAGMEEVKSRFAERAPGIVKEFLDDAYREYGVIEVAKVREVFRSAVEQFYSSYGPKYYGRTGGLYDVLDINLDEYGMVSTDAAGYIDLFNPGNLHPDRSGGSLFDKVFMQGWHGGATGTDKHGVSRGSPSYRAPYGKYWNWGSYAVRTESPASIFAREYAAEDNGFLQREFDRLVEQYSEKAVDRLGVLLDEWIAELL